MSSLNKIIFILLPTIILITVLNLVSGILLPFIVAIIIAYFLDPIADKLEDKKILTRGMSSILVVILFIFFIAVFFYFLGPILYRQAISLISSVPAYLKTFNEFITPYIQVAYDKIGYKEVYNNATIIQKISAYLIESSQVILKEILSSSFAVINLFSLIFITPIVTFYFLKDWNKISHGIIQLLPKKHSKETILQLQKIDQVLSSYIRGQTNVCLILGTFYAISLQYIAGLHNGILIGFITGILSFIPYFGVLIGMIIGVVVSSLQFDNYLSTLLVLFIFLIGQFLEGNFVTPRLVGKEVGLHPALIIFSVLAGGSLFGFYGILFAIPTVAILNVLLQLAVQKYLTSNFFKK